MPYEGHNYKFISFSHASALSLRATTASCSLSKVIMSCCCCMLGCAFLTNTHFATDVAFDRKICCVGIVVPSLQYPAKLYCTLKDYCVMSVKYLGIKFGGRIGGFVWRI